MDTNIRTHTYIKDAHCSSICDIVYHCNFFIAICIIILYQRTPSSNEILYMCLISKPVIEDKCGHKFDCRWNAKCIDRPEIKRCVCRQGFKEN